MATIAVVAKCRIFRSSFTTGEVNVTRGPWKSWRAGSKFNFCRNSLQPALPHTSFSNWTWTPLSKPSGFSRETFALCSWDTQNIFTAKHIKCVTLHPHSIIHPLTALNNGLATSCRLLRVHKARRQACGNPSKASKCRKALRCKPESSCSGNTIVAGTSFMAPIKWNPVYDRKSCQPWTPPTLASTACWAVYLGSASPSAWAILFRELAIYQNKGESKSLLDTTPNWPCFAESVKLLSSVQMASARFGEDCVLGLWSDHVRPHLCPAACSQPS